MNFIKKSWMYMVIFFVALLLGSVLGSNQEELEKANAKNEELIKEKNKLADEFQEAKEIAVAISKERDELKVKVEEAEPWFKLSEEEKKKKEEELKKAEEKRIADEKAKKEAEEKAKIAAEEKAKKEAEEKEKKGYNTGITYDQIARTPDKYVGEKVKFTGKVIQVMELENEVQIRFAVNDDYDKIIYGVYESSIVDARILEDDKITIYGLSADLMTYESTMGATISIPNVLIQKIEQ